jgi:hypothetical protein
MMHAVAWLLNHRAYFMGELSEFQLRRYGRLAPDFPAADPDRMALLSPKIRTLIAATEEFYARLLRIDRSCAKPRPARRAPLTNCAPVWPAQWPDPPSCRHSRQGAAKRHRLRHEYAPAPMAHRRNRATRTAGGAPFGQ